MPHCGDHFNLTSYSLCELSIRQFKQPNVTPGTERNPERTANQMHTICHTPQNNFQSLAVLSELRSVPGVTFGA